MSLARTVLRSSLVETLTTPHGVDRFLELVNPLWTVHDLRARIVDIHRETTAGEPVATLTLEPSLGWQGHQAGQFVQVGVEVDGTRHTRCFSVSSAESKPGDLITLTIRANPGGTVSRHLVEHAEVGETIHLSQAAGDFTLPTPLPEQLLFISGGSGITPVMSMLRTALRHGYGGAVTFLHYAQSPDHQIFGDELAAMPPNVRVRRIYPECGDPAYTTQELAALVPDHAAVDTFACGPAGLIEKVQQTYADNPRLRVEYFKTSTLTASQTAPAEGRVRFARSEVEVANSGAPLLEQAEAAGLQPAYGCRMGICFTCTSRKSEGTVRNLVSGEQSTRADEDIRICVSAAVGDCVVDL